MNMEQRLIDAEALKRVIKTECNPYGNPTIDFESGKKVLKIIDNAPVVKFSQWIPIRTRRLTDEEIEDFLETRAPEELPEFMFDCELPQDGEEILICFSSGVISQDIYEYDPDYGAGLEGNGDFEGVIAWMSLPEPYIPEENTDE